MSKIKRRYGRPSYGGTRTYRYKRKYSGSPYYKRTRRKKILSTTLISLLCVAALGIGFFSMRLILNKIDTGEKETSPSPVTTEETQPSGSEDQATQPQPTEPSVDPEDSGIRAITANVEILNGGNALQEFLSTASQNNVNAVVLDLKDSNGYVRYPSALEQVIAAEAISAPVTGIADSLRQLQDQNIKVIARIYCFKDHVASSNMVEAAVQYKNKGYHWLDASPNAGGRSWLNPYSPIAQSYLIDIVREVSAMGFDGIMLDGVQKPEGYSLDAATYGAEADQMTLSEALSSFIRSVESSVPDAVSVSVAMKGDGAIQGNPDLYGDNPLDLGESIACPNLCYNSFSNGIDIGENAYSPGSSNAADFISAAARELVSRASLGSREIMLMPFIEGSGSVLDAQISALKDVGVENYIVVIPAAQEE